MNVVPYRARRFPILGACILMGSIACAAEQFSGIARLQSRFPDSVTIESRTTGSYFQFCPDNTCDLIKAEKPISAEELAEIGYVYIYYFSDYTELKEWRSGQAEASAAKQILSRDIYSACNDKQNMEQATCVLQLAKIRFDLSLYFVRYDENERHQERSAFPIS